MSQNILQVVFALGAVIALFLAMAWTMRRFTQGTGLGGRHLKIISAMSVGTREKVMLVDVEGQQLLLGVTGQQISTLHTFKEPVVIENTSTPTSDFAQKLQAILLKPTVSPKDTE